MKRLGGLLLFAGLVFVMMTSKNPATAPSANAVTEPVVVTEKSYDDYARERATEMLAKSSLREIHDHIRAAAFIPNVR